MQMRASGQTWLAVLILLAALLARQFWPVKTMELRQEILRVLAADRCGFELVQAMGRAAANRDWRGEMIEALGNSLQDAVE
jgi:hypothetical protein